MFNLFHFIQDKYLKIKYSKYYYKPTRAGFEAYKHYLSKDYIAPHVLPPAPSSQIISLLSCPDLYTNYSKYDWTYMHDDADAFFLFFFWDDYKEHGYSEFFDWCNKAWAQNERRYTYITYDAILFNPATLTDYCHLCEFAENELNKRKYKEQEEQEQIVRIKQIENLKSLTSYLQSLQNKDKETFERVLTEDSLIQKQLEDENKKYLRLKYFP